MTRKPLMRIQDIARICHEANKAYCDAIGDDSQPSWADAPEWQTQSACNGVSFHLENPDAGPSGSHKNWMAEKLANGWVWGDVKDPEAKTHPCLVPYDELPKTQQYKDFIFVGIVHALSEVS